MRMLVPAHALPHLTSHLSTLPVLFFLLQLNNAALNSLAAFYGVQFGPNNGGGG
jgi:hypothetical protein